MEDVYTTEGKITATTKFSTTETTSSKLPTLSITGRIGELEQYLYIIQATYIHSDSTTEERTFWIYVMAIGSLITAGLGIFCCYFFWC